MDSLKSDIYIKLDGHVRVDRREVRLKDMASVYCSDAVLMRRLENVPVFVFEEKDGEKEVISILYVYAAIYKSLGKDLQIHSIGSEDCLVDLISERKPSKLWSRIQVVLVSMVTFFGAAFSIMAFNNDIGVTTLFSQLYETFTGKKSNGFTILELSYSIGVGLGILIFFHHFAKKKGGTDPTPLEVEMRTYEDEIDTTIIESGNRKELQC